MLKLNIRKIKIDKAKENQKLINLIFILLFNLILYYINLKDIINKLKNIINNMNKILLEYYKKTKKSIRNISIIELNKINNYIENIIKYTKIKFNNNEILYMNKYLNKKINKLFILYYFMLIEIDLIKSYSTIALFIEGNVSSQILNNDFKNKPSEIFVNGIAQNNSQYKIDNLEK